MGKIEAETCSVCKENPSKYRCPGCATPYCSLACNKVHKSGAGGDSSKPPCTGKRALPEAGVRGAERRQSPGKRTRVRSGSDDVETATTSCVRKSRDQWRGGREDREEEEWQMSADQRARISGCAWLKPALRDPKLQDLLVSLLC